MTDEAALIAAYADHPDDAHRLVLADWLDEHSDPRGGWLRDAELARYMGPRVEHPAIGLIAAVQQGDASARGRLIVLGASAVPWLVDAPAWPPSSHLDGIVEAIRDAVPGLSALCERVLSDDPREQLASIRAIGDLGEEGTAGFAALWRVAQRNDSRLWDAVVETVCRFGRWRFSALQVLLESLDEDALPASAKLVATLEQFWPEPNAGRLLVRCLDRPLSALVEAAANTSERLGLPIVGHLLNAFCEANHPENLAPVLVRFGRPVVPSLVRAASELSRHSQVRLGAIEALSLFANQPEAREITLEIIGHLSDLLEDADQGVRLAALKGLERFGERAAPAIPRLLHPPRNEQEASAILDVLLAIGPAAAAAMPAVLELRDADGQTRHRAARFVQRFGDRAGLVTEVRQQLRHPLAGRRIDALHTLEQIADELPDVGELLLAALGDVHPAVREEAVSVLSGVTLSDAESIELFRLALRDEVSAVRRLALRHLAESPDWPGEGLWAELRPFLAEDSSRLLALQAAGRYGRELELLAHMRHAFELPGYEQATWPVAEILDHWPDLPGEGVLALIAWLRHPNSRLVSLAQRWLDRIDPVPAQILALVREMLHEGHRCAIQLLERWEYQPTADDGPALRRAIRAPEPNAAGWAIILLARLGPAVIPDLLGCLDSPESNIQGTSARVLGDFGPLAEPALPRLRAMLEEERSFVYSRLPAAIVRIAAPADAVDGLRVGLSNRCWMMRAAVLRELATLGANALVIVTDLLGVLRREVDRQPLDALVSLFESLATHSFDVTDAVRALLDEPSPACDNARRVLDALESSGEP